ncbi:hypothetical protein NBM05_11385 [Rothia sp. AR01]|uniref:Small multidrug efflux protein n=1 Tax=Rothia santali TaxID=2949643 RepID=A0A9X2HHB3_9MICC|nr:hypothetical protein [Rothia santali]MCP3426587.1 hypothetical protein [Rothia santali]
MNDAISQTFEFLAQLHPVVQFLGVLGIGVVPFLESYVAAPVGFGFGMHWSAAYVAAVLGNVLAVVAAVGLAGWIRGRRTAGRERSARQERVMARVDRWGVPVASLLAPTVLAISLTSFILTASGLRARTVILWNVVASMAWGAITLLGVMGLFSALS